MRYLSVWPNQKSLARDFWRQFDDMFGSLDESRRELEEGAFHATLDVEESPKSYMLKFDLPGLKREEIKIEVRENTLFVSGERKREKKTDGEFARYERVFGRFERALSLPKNIEADKIVANYTDGVLTLTVPKSENGTSKVIEVK